MSSQIRDHAVMPSRTFDDFAVGEVFKNPSRTMSDAQLLAFQAVSGDNHPIHYDREYCKAHGHPELLAHGLHVLCQVAAGAGPLAHAMSDCLVAFLDQSSEFLSPVYVGDTLYPEFEIIELIRQSSTGVLVAEARVFNQRDELALRGRQRYLLRLPVEEPVTESEWPDRLD